MVSVELEMFNGGVLHDSRDASSTGLCRCVVAVSWLDQGGVMMDSP